MLRTVLAILVIASCRESADEPAPPPAPAAAQPPAPKPAPAAKPVDDIAAANAAYEAKQWAKCAELYVAIADRASAPARLKSESTYNAGCCYAQDGKRDAAFPLLERSVALGMRDKKHVEADPDLAGIHDDARWPKLLASLDKAIADVEKAMREPALRRELLALVDVDQKARFAWIAKQDDKSLAAAVETIDKKSTARLKQVVAKYGWPGKSLVGEDGAHAAWLLVQHADKDAAFQKEVLAKMDPMVATDEVSAIDRAYLYDRVAVAEHRKQLYGTQFDNRQEPQPIEDEANVDARRAAIGLPSMADYRQQMRKMYGPPKKS